MFCEKTDEKFKNYIKATQCGTVRFDVSDTPKEVEGLCTDGTSQCVTIIISNKKRMRFSLTHTDLAVDENAVISECEWVGVPCELHIIPGVSYRDPNVVESTGIDTTTNPRIMKAIKDVGIDIEIHYSKYNDFPGSVAIKREGEITCFAPEEIISDKEIKFRRIGEPSPDIAKRHCINILNSYALSFKKRYHPLDIQYDVKQWTELPELNAEAEHLVQNHRQIDLTSVPHDFIIFLVKYRALYLESDAEYAKQKGRHGFFKGQDGTSEVCNEEEVALSKIIVSPGEYFNRLKEQFLEKELVQEGFLKEIENTRTTLRNKDTGEARKANRTLASLLNKFKKTEEYQCQPEVVNCSI